MWRSVVTVLVALSLVLGSHWNQLTLYVCQGDHTVRLACCCKDEAASGGCCTVIKAHDDGDATPIPPPPPYVAVLGTRLPDLVLRPPPVPSTGREVHTWEIGPPAVGPPIWLSTRSLRL